MSATHKPENLQAFVCFLESQISLPEKEKRADTADTCVLFSSLGPWAVLMFCLCLRKLTKITVLQMLC